MPEWSEWDDDADVRAEEYRAHLEAMWKRIAAKVKRVTVCPVCGCAPYRVRHGGRWLSRTAVEPCPLCEDRGCITITQGQRDDLV